MAALVKYTAFEPLITGPLLWTLTRGSPDLRARILRPLASLPFNVEPEKIVKGLKWLFALGLAGRINSWLNAWALNNWQLGETGRPWIWKDEIIVITGGSGGLATEMIKKLAPTGMKIAIMDLSPPPAAIGSLPNVSFYETDITSSESVHDVASRIKKDLGAPSILVNNAGIGKTYNIIEVPDAYLDKIFKINLISHWYTVREFLPGMISARKGHIITTASMASYTAVAGMVDYCCTKAGTMAFHEGLTQELKHRYKAPFIKTTAIHPYWVKTNLIAGWVEKGLAKAGSQTMTPEYVGGKMAEAVLSGKSGHMTLPTNNLTFQLATGARGWPYWAQALVHDSTKYETAVVNA